MSNWYLIDNNVLRFAMELTDCNDHFSADAYALLSRIIMKCHGIIVSREEHRFLQNRIGNIDNIQIKDTPGFDLLLRSFLLNNQKYKVSNNKYEVDNPSIYPRKDLHIVEVALAEKVPIVTEDTKLAIAVNKSQECKGQNVKAINIRDCLMIHT